MSRINTEELIIDSAEVAVPFSVKSRLNALATRPRAEEPERVVLHVDITFNSESTEGVLRKRGRSTHFGVDGDDVGGWATVWQWGDPMEDVTFHDGPANEQSIGVDVNTPLSLKYQRRDEGFRGRSRPVLTGLSRGKGRTVLGLFPSQLQTLWALAQILEEHCGLPIEYPRAKGGAGDWITDLMPDWEDWRGWLGHHHVPTSHWCPGPVGVQVAEWFAVQEVERQVVAAQELAARAAALPESLREMPAASVEIERIAAAPDRMVSEPELRRALDWVTGLSPVGPGRDLLKWQRELLERLGLEVR